MTDDACRSMTTDESEAHLAALFAAVADAAIQTVADLQAHRAIHAGTIEDNDRVVPSPSNAVDEWPATPLEQPTSEPAIDRAEIGGDEWPPTPFHQPAPLFEPGADDVLAPELIEEPASGDDDTVLVSEIEWPQPPAASAYPAATDTPATTWAEFVMAAIGTGDLATAYWTVRSLESQSQPGGAPAVLAPCRVAGRMVDENCAGRPGAV